MFSIFFLRWGAVLSGIQVRAYSDTYASANAFSADCVAFTCRMVRTQSDFGLRNTRLSPSICP